VRSLKRVVEDAKSLYAFDRIGGVDVLREESYFLRAVECAVLNKKALCGSRSRSPSEASGHAEEWLGGSVGGGSRL
jgi:hypothetical protein